MSKAPHQNGAGKEYMKALDKLYSKPSPDIHKIKAVISPADFYQYSLPDIPRT